MIVLTIQMQVHISMHLHYTIILCIILSCYFSNVNKTKTQTDCALYNSDVYRDAAISFT